MDHDTQEAILNFPFDHLYACHTDNADVPSDNILNNIQNEQATEIMQLTNKLNNADKEIRHLKDLILIHLDLIQQQSDELSQKDKEIISFQQEIEKLKASNAHNENALNFRLQNINPPPLIHLAPAQTASTVTILPDTSSQVQIANLANLISTTAVENKKQDTAETFTCYSTLSNKDNIPYANLGALLDTRYIQCSDNSFETQPSICLQPLVQTSLQSSIPSVTSYIHPESIINHFDSIPLELNRNSISPVEPILEEDKISAELNSQKEMGSKLSDNSLTINKKCKTIYTYELNSKKCIKKTTKKIIQEHDNANKPSKRKDNLQKLFPNTVEKILINRPQSNVTRTKSKLSVAKYSSNIDNKQLCKSDQTSVKHLTINTKDKFGEIKVIKQEKLMQPRKFFTSGMKEKASCRDFSYGENFANMKFMKSNSILEYLEGNQPTVQPDVEILDLNVNNQSKLSNYLSKFLNNSPTPNNNVSENSILDDGNIMEIKREVKQEIDDEDKEAAENDDVVKIDLYEFQSSEEFESNNHLDCDLVFTGNFGSDGSTSAKSNQKKNFKSSMCLNTQEPSMMDDGSLQIPNYKGTDRKKNVRRKRALSSASKVSNVSQGDTPMPHSWAFSGQDFKILTEDINSSYFVPTFGGSDSYFTLENITQQSADPALSKTASLEVPSWRIKFYSPDPYARTDENMDEDIFLKRHNKAEAEEKRRKRWDFQMIREQLIIKKLKEGQERRNSGGFKSSRNSKCSSIGFPDELPQSLYPSSDDIFTIDITDTLPVTAFGECIPDIPPRSFQLPWVLRSRQRLHSSCKKKFKFDRSEEE